MENIHILVTDDSRGVRLFKMKAGSQASQVELNAEALEVFEDYYSGHTVVETKAMKINNRPKDGKSEVLRRGLLDIVPYSLEGFKNMWQGIDMYIRTVNKSKGEIKHLAIGCTYNELARRSILSKEVEGL